MFSRSLTSVSTGACSEAVDRLREALNRADAVVVGAGAGLSASAGLTYDGARFEEHFGDFNRQIPHPGYVCRRLLPL